MRNRVIICIALFVALTLCACSSSDPSHSENTSNTQTSSVSTEHTKTPVQTESGPKGYTLEELNGKTGMFYILEDGSFARYSGGFKMQWAETWESEGSILYMPIERVNNNPVLTSDDTIAIFENVNIHVKLFPVAARGTTVSFDVDGESVLLNPVIGLRSLDVIYYPIIKLEEKEKDYLQVINSTDEHLFGVQEEEVVCTLYDYNQVNDKTTTETITFDSFPMGKDITITYVVGTKAVQETKKADYKYYAFGDYFNAFDPNVAWPDAKVTPTVHGYAEVSLENVPAGQYVMIVSTENNRYYGTVITVI